MYTCKPSVAVVPPVLLNSMVAAETVFAEIKSNIKLIVKDNKHRVFVHFKNIVDIFRNILYGATTVKIKAQSQNLQTDLLCNLA